MSLGWRIVNCELELGERNRKCGCMSSGIMPFVLSFKIWRDTEIWKCGNMGLDLLLLSPSVL